MAQPNNTEKRNLTLKEFIRQMGHVGIPEKDLNTIYEIGLGMCMDPRDIFDFTKNSGIKEALTSTQLPREQIRRNLMNTLPYDDVARREAEVATSFKRFVIIRALREHLKRIGLEGLELEL
ncbi:hypothetical protein KKA33_02025 [Patescibacteria group bacterium]|nr:hypothetical protein [Patescibacteria group bacterium]